MPEVIGRLSPQAFALLRLISGVMFFLHGSQKFFGWPPSEQPGGALPPILVAASWIEMVAGLMIAVGFFTGIAALIASGEMAAAYFMAHFPRGFWPIVNQGELAVAYCFVFLYIASRGSGMWSVDRTMRRS